MAPIIGIMASANWSSANASSFESIASATGTGSNTSITFSSIPSTYTSLQIRVLARNTNGSTDASISQFTLNGDTTAANYAWHELRGDGTTASASGASGAIPYYGMVVRNGATAGIMGVSVIDIHNYASTSQNKTVRSFSGNDRNGAGIVGLWSGLYISTSAVSSLTLYAGTTATTTTYFTTDTVIALYGIKG